MRSVKILILCLGLILLTGSVLMADTGDLSQAFRNVLAKVKASKGENSIVAREVAELNGEQFLFLKVMDSNGTVTALNYNSKGKQVADEKLPKVKKSLVSKGLKDMISQKNKGQLTTISDFILVNVALQDEAIETDEAPQSGEVTVYDNGQYEMKIDGRSLQEYELNENQKTKWAGIQNLKNTRKVKINSKLDKFADRNGMKNNKAILEAQEAESGTLTIALKFDEIEAFAEKNSDLVAGMEVYVEGSDQISSAMLSSGVDPYALNYANRLGQGIGIYMTESGAANPGRITNYYRISGSETDHSRNVSGILRAVSPESYVYGKGGAVLPTSTDLAGYNGNPRIHIVTRSNGGGDDGSFTTSDRDWDNFVYDNAVPTFVSAGNNGNLNGYVISPANGLNIISVGNYDDATDTISSSSSYKNPQTKNAKPELSAPGTNITAGGFTMSGTSMSCPHAAAAAADLMEAYSWLVLKPYYVKALMMSGSTKSITGGADKVGVGGIDFYNIYYNSTNSWWEGGNGAFATWDSGDPVPNNGYIERQVSLDASLSSVRIVLCWLNRGTYTYDHRTDAHPIGMDFDITILNPSGTAITSSSSFDNPYEMVTFDPTVTGTYTVRISRFANRDTSSKIHMGLSVNW